MRRLRYFVALALLAFGCNGILGLDAGRPKSEKAGGASGAGDASGSGESGSSGSSTNGGSSSTTGGSGGRSGESGSSAGGVAGAEGGRGGDGGSAGGGGDPGPGGAGAGGAPPCTSSLDCRADGHDFCIDGTCTDITSPECDVILGDEWINEDPEAKPYVIGAISRYFVSDSPGGEPFYPNLVLAMREFSGFGRIPIEGEGRRPVLLLCHHSYSSELTSLEASLDHLTGLGVSSVLLLVNSRSDVEALVNRSLNQRGDNVFFLDVGGGTGWLDGGLLNLPDSGRLWHMQGDAHSFAYPYVPLVERIEEAINPGASTGNAAEPTRLAIIHGTEDEFDRATFDALSDFSQTLLHINGMPLNSQPGQVLVVSEDANDGTRLVHQMIADFRAHIVLDFGSRSASQLYFVERAFIDRNVPRPFYVLTFWYERQFHLLGELDMDNPSWRKRVLGFRAASANDPTLHRAYVERIRSIAPEWYLDARDRDVRHFDIVYDATYYLMYAAVAGGPGGTAKAAGFRRLIDGPQREIGPGGIASVLARLASNENATLSLSGPSGDFGFHAPSGGRLAFSNAWCVDENLEGGYGYWKLDYVFDVLRYDHTSGDLTGTITCFDG